MLQALQAFIILIVIAIALGHLVMNIGHYSGYDSDHYCQYAIVRFWLFLVIFIVVLIEYAVVGTDRHPI